MPWLKQEREKTAAFGLPIVQQFDISVKAPQALILSPTRELALQIAKDLENFSKNIKGAKIATLYGGSDIRKQIKELESGAQIVVGTPGRTLDLIKRKKLKVNEIQWLVLDEADEMLSMGFKDDLDAILKDTPAEKTDTVCFRQQCQKKSYELPVHTWLIRTKLQWEKGTPPLKM